MIDPVCEEVDMFKKPIVVIAMVAVALTVATAASREETRRFSAPGGGTLDLDLEAGGSVWITGGGAGISVSYTVPVSDTGNFRVEFEESVDGLEISTRRQGRQDSRIEYVEFDIQVPSHFNVKLDSMGGSLSIEGVEGTFTGKTMGGALTLHDVRGKAKLHTLGGEIHLTNSDLDGSLETNGGEVLFQDVFGDVKGTSLGGNVRYQNVERRDGTFASPERLGDLDAITAETVQISTMGGSIEIEEASKGADLHTMGGDIRVARAERFLRARTLGGDIYISSVDGWVDATTNGGDIQATVTGHGGDVTLISLSGDITLHVPPGFGMDLDLEIAFTRNSNQQYRIETDFDLQQSISPEWDHERRTPRKYIRGVGTAHGGGHRVKIETINGNIRVVSGK
jgi:DUF4097 and DUF4098 domain-containing protein YvlB